MQLYTSGTRGLSKDLLNEAQIAQQINGQLESPQLSLSVPHQAGGMWSGLFQRSLEVCYVLVDTLNLP